MGKAHFCFGASFFLLATSGTLLLTWTCWWMAVVGPSMPARRPFFRPAEEVPELIQAASQYSGKPVFIYSLAGGWPTSNSILRLLASLVAVLCSFSFAFLASLAPARTTRRIFSFSLAAVALFGLVAAILDGVSLAKTSSECRNEQCVTQVPQNVIDAGNVCKCKIDSWFYFTLVVDTVLYLTAFCCLLLTVWPRIRPSGLSQSS